MPGAAGRDVLVHGIRLAAPGIAHDRCDDTIPCVKRRLQAPEAATRKCRPGEVGTIRHVLYILSRTFPKGLRHRLPPVGGRRLPLQATSTHKPPFGMAPIAERLIG